MGNMLLGWDYVNEDNRVLVTLRTVTVATSFFSSCFISDWLSERNMVVAPKIDKVKLAELHAFIKLLEQDPEILYSSPELEFFRRFMGKHGE